MLGVINNLLIKNRAVVTTVMQQMAGTLPEGSLAKRLSTGPTYLSARQASDQPNILKYNRYLGLMPPNEEPRKNVRQLFTRASWGPRVINVKVTQDTQKQIPPKADAEPSFIKQLILKMSPSLFPLIIAFISALAASWKWLSEQANEKYLRLIEEDNRLVNEDDILLRACLPSFKKTYVDYFLDDQHLEIVSNDHQAITRIDSSLDQHHNDSLTKQLNISLTNVRAQRMKIFTFIEKLWSFSRNLAPFINDGDKKHVEEVLIRRAKEHYTKCYVTELMCRLGLSLNKRDFNEVLIICCELEAILVKHDNPGRVSESEKSCLLSKEELNDLNSPFINDIIKYYYNNKGIFLYAYANYSNDIHVNPEIIHSLSEVLELSSVDNILTSSLLIDALISFTTSGSNEPFVQYNIVLSLFKLKAYHDMLARKIIYLNNCEESSQANELKNEINILKLKLSEVMHIKFEEIISKCLKINNQIFKHKIEQPMLIDIKATRAAICCDYLAELTAGGLDKKSQKFLQIIDFINHDLHGLDNISSNFLVMETITSVYLLQEEPQKALDLIKQIPENSKTARIALNESKAHFQLNNPALAIAGLKLLKRRYKLDDHKLSVDHVSYFEIKSTLYAIENGHDSNPSSQGNGFFRPASTSSTTIAPSESTPSMHNGGM